MRTRESETVPRLVGVFPPFCVSEIHVGFCSGVLAVLDPPPRRCPAVDHSLVWAPPSLSLLTWLIIRACTATSRASGDKPPAD